MSSSDFDSSQGSIMVSSEASTGPSRLDSFSSSGGFGAPSNDFTMQTSFDEKFGNIPTSPLSSTSSHGKVGAVSQLAEPISTTNSTTDHSTNDQVDIEELEIVKSERAVSPTIQKWVDESCAQTERLKSSGKLSPIAISKDDGAEIRDEETPASDLALQQALEYSLRAVSPNFARTGSLDGAFTSLGDFQSQMTPTESMLLGLGFGGPDLGIPVRFLKSWREQVIKRKITELQGLLGRSRKSPSPTGSARQYNPKPVEAPKCQEIPQAKHVVPNKDKVKQQVIQQHSVVTKSVVKPTEKQLQLEKLKNMRQQLRRSATFSAFSPNTLVDLKQSNGKDHRKKGAMSDKKYQKLRGATRGNAKDRRRVFGTRQSSLPISLETLPEEDEGGRPLFLQQKSSSLDLVDDTISADASSATSLNSSQHDVRVDGSETGSAVDPLERFHRNGPKIVMSGPSSSSLDAVLSEGGNLANKSETFEEKYGGNHLLVVKNMIESKDSGFGNDISNGGSPQLSPEHQAPQACLSRSGCGGVVSSADDPTKSMTNHSTDTQEWKRKTDKSNEKLGRVDLCIQCDFTDSDSESDVECFSAGVQTSPWLQSGELSPLLCTETDSIDRTGTQDLGSKGNSLLNNYHSDINGFDSELSEQILLSENSNLPYPDGFNSERRRLSRIEEVTEGTMSYQSEEDKIKPSFGSQQDSSQTMSTDSSSRPNSSLVVSDGLKANEELHSENFERTADHDFKRLRKKIYKEMLNRNSEPDLVHEEKLIQLRAAYHQEKVPNPLTVDETLIKAAEKLELCLNEERKHDASEEQDQQIPDVKGKDELNINRDTVHKNVHRNQHTPQSFPKSSSGTSPNEQLGSIRSRHFFASNNFLSFTENVRHSGRSSATSESDVSDVASFFSVPINLENGEEEFDVNFSLTGSDMNLVSGEDDYFPIFSVNEGFVPFWEKEHSFGEDDCQSENVVSKQSYSDNPDVNSAKGTGGFLSQAYINKKRDSLQTHAIDDPWESSVGKDLPSKASKGDYFSPPYQVGAFSESNMDLVSQHGNVFTETLEIEVPSLHQEKNVELSQCFVALQPVTHDGYLNSLRNDRSIPCRYSSKYYFSIDDYSLESVHSPNEAARNKTTLSTRRRSLIDAHLSAKKFDEFVCAKSAEDRWSGSEEVLHPPFVAVSKEFDPEDERLSTASRMSPMQNEEGREGSNSFGDVVNLHQGHTKWDNIPIFNRMSSDSQASIGSSVTSSKVEQYVDSVLEYALEDVRGSEVDKNKFKNAIPVTLHRAHDGAGLNAYSPPSCQENAHTHGMFHKDINQASLEDSGVLCNGNDTRKDHILYQPSGEESQYEGYVDFQSRLAIAYQKKCKEITTETGKDNVVTDTGQLTLCADGKAGAAAHDHGQLQVGGGLVLVNGNKTESLNNRSDNLYNGFVHSPEMNSNPNRSSSNVGQMNGDRKVCLGKINIASNNLNEGRELKSDTLQGNQDGGELEHDRYFLRQPESSSHIPKRSELLLSYEELCSKAQDLISNMNALIAGNH